MEVVLIIVYYFDIFLTSKIYIDGSEVHNYTFNRRGGQLVLLRFLDRP